MIRSHLNNQGHQSHLNNLNCFVKAFRTCGRFGCFFCARRHFCAQRAGNALKSNDAWKPGTCRGVFCCGVLRKCQKSIVWRQTKHGFGAEEARSEGQRIVGEKPTPRVALANAARGVEGHTMLRAFGRRFLCKKFSCFALKDKTARYKPLRHQISSG